MSEQIFSLGAAYYPEHLTTQNPWIDQNGKLQYRSVQDTIEADLERMVANQISIIRMGEFSWSSVEPMRNQFSPDLFLFTLKVAERLGIKVVFCTPTAAPPKWLVDEMPDILPENAHGQTISFGSRRHYDPSHPGYREEAKRITEYYAKTFGVSSAISMWQIDNEFGGNSSAFQFGEHTKLGFQNWLKEKYVNINTLNDDYFSAFWSQKYSDFSQIELPKATYATHNPHLELDFRRYCTLAFRRFQNDQSQIIRKLSPHVTITHNFMTSASDLCPWEMSADLDIAGFNHYQMTSKPHFVTSAWQFSLMRSLKFPRKFFVLEQQPVQVNWQNTNRRYSFSNLFLWGNQAAFNGASGMLYFSWQKMYGGAEQYHDGIVPHDVRVELSSQEKVLRAKAKSFTEMRDFFKIKELPYPDPSWLCIYNSESLWTHEIAPQSQEYSTKRVIDDLARMASASGLGMDFAPTIESAKSRYRHRSLLILPGYAFELTDSEKQILKEYLQSGGKILSLPRTGVKRKSNQMSPFPLDFFGEDELILEESAALLSDETEKILVDHPPIECNGILWAEKIQVKNEDSSQWKVLARFSGGYYDDYPAALLNNRYAGRWLHLAFQPKLEPSTVDWIISALDEPTQIRMDLRGDLQAFPLSLGRRRFIGLINFGQTATLQLTQANPLRAITSSLDPKLDLKVHRYPALGPYDLNLIVPKESASILEIS